MNKMVTSNSLSKLSNKSRKIGWPEASATKQVFSLSDSIIYYITKNPSRPEVYMKLVQSCKSFFEKNPILVVNRITNGGRKVCSKYRVKCNRQCCINVDISKLSSKIWLIMELRFSTRSIPNFVPIIIPKLFRCENTCITINYPIITIADFKLLATKYDIFYFHGVEFLDNDGNAMMLEKILELIPNVKEFFYYFDGVTPAMTTLTMKKISKLPNLGKLQRFHLYFIPQAISVEDIANFIEYYKNTKFWLHFAYDISLSQEYKKQLVDTLIASETQGRVLQYPGQNTVKYEIMESNY